MLNRLSLNGFYSVDSSQIESLNKPTLSRRHYFATLLPNRLTQAFTKSGGPTEDDIPSSYSSYSSVFGRYQPPILKKNEGTKKRMKMLGSLGRKRQHPQRSGSDIDSVNSFSTYANASGATEDDLSSIVVSEMEDSIVSEVLKDHHAFESLFVRQPYFIGLRYRSEDHLSNQSQSQSFTSQGDASGAQHGVINVVRSYISALEAAEHDPVYSASATQARQRTRTERNRTLIRSSRPLGLGSSRQVRQQNLSVSSVPGNPITGTLPRHMHSIRDTSRRMRAITRVTGYLTDYLDPFTSNSEEDNRLGFANLPDQMHRKAVKKGFNFTLIVVGESKICTSSVAM
ncbi:unnamed protein product [Protopolystoma xenopodis]|uniref:Uncharacterized protein n=1 Tax=Protopolystoma xenopodis TaxID=117903 RepID=A0A3S5A9S8_9PLAT|nr:unnamed protein product [Protopolystoma xenopodis]